MSMIEVVYSQGALDPSARDWAAERLTAALLHHQGSPDTERTRAMTWCTLHELSPSDESLESVFSYLVAR